MGDSWFKQGAAGYAEKKKIDTAAKIKKEKGVPRFWLKDGDEAKIIFVDSSPFFCYEHNVKADGKYGNYLTCTKDFAPCAICAEGERATYTAYLTAIDTRSYTNYKGEEIKNRRILYPAKGSTILRIEGLIKTHGDLAGHVFVVKRYTAQDPNCGVDFEHKGQVNIAEKLGATEAQSHDYEKVLCPPTPAELAGLGFGDYKIAGSADDIGTGTDDSSDVDIDDLLQ